MSRPLCCCTSRSIGLFLLCAHLSLAARASSPQDAVAPPPVLDEVTVTGERTGPGMWHVSRGDAHLWILGSLAPLPKGITWRSKQVEQLLDTTTQVVIQKPFDIGIARILWLLITERSLLLLGWGKHLRDVMPAPLYTRFSALRAKYTNDPDKWERYRPLIASAFLQQAALHQMGLSMRLDLGAAVRMLAKQHHVRIEELTIAGVGDLLNVLKTVSPSSENLCVDASLVTVESDLPRLVDRARAWATGNVERLESLRGPEQVDSCIAALEQGTGARDLIAEMRRTWLDSMQAHLAKPGVTIAVVNLDMLLEKGGLLEQLRDQGYVIDAP